MDNFFEFVAGVRKIWNKPPHKVIYLDGLNGGASASGADPTHAVSTLDAAVALTTTGKNDTILVVGNAGTTASVRLSAATTITRNALTIKGINSGSMFSPRARIAPTAATTAFANFLTLTGSGNRFENLTILQDFDTDTTNQIALTVVGHYNVFKNCHIFGIASAADAGGRCLKIQGSENLFEDCVIGQDTIARSAANATIQLVSVSTNVGSARNIFRRCIFPFNASGTAPLLLLTTGTNAIDRFTLFEDCLFVNSGGAVSTIAGLCTMAASAGGDVIFKNPMLSGPITGFGTDAATRLQIRINGVASGSTTTGIGYAPSA